MKSLFIKLHWFEAAVLSSVITAYLVITFTLTLEPVTHSSNKNSFYTVGGAFTALATLALVLKFYSFALQVVGNFKIKEKSVMMKIVNVILLVYLIALIPGSFVFMFSAESLKILPSHFTLLAVNIVNSIVLFIVCAKSFYNDFIKENENENV